MEWSFQKKLDRQKAAAEERQKWHKWFAWYPVRVPGNKKIWLETVYRREDKFSEVWRYKTLMDILKEEDSKSSNIASPGVSVVEIDMSSI